MPRLRRFKVPSLKGARPESVILLPASEARHTRVLRLKEGTEVELFDGEGRVLRARLAGERATVIEQSPAAPSIWGPRLVLATAWPKGKRAAVMVEKCAELGVAEIVPLRCARSVVLKESGSEGLSRLRRIAAEAAKQCGRADVPAFSAERSFAQVVMEEAPNAVTVLLDGAAPRSLLEVLNQEALALSEPNAPVLLCIVGPEGGFSPEDVEIADRAGLRRARLGENVLRVETAAIAACAAFAAWRKVE